MSFINKEKLQEISFQIIAFAGVAHQNYYEAIEKARKGDFKSADSLMKEGN